MDIDFESLAQLMGMMNEGSPVDHRKQQIMQTMLKLMETKKLMEAYEAPNNMEGYEDRNIHMLVALRPHMTGERRHMTDILIKLFEIKQIIDQMEAGRYGY